MTEQIEPVTPSPRWTTPVIIGSLVVVGAAFVFGVLCPKARKAITAGILISPIPPIP